MSALAAQEVFEAGFDPALANIVLRQVDGDRIPLVVEHRSAAIVALDGCVILFLADRAGVAHDMAQLFADQVTPLQGAVVNLHAGEVYGLASMPSATSFEMPCLTINGTYGSKVP